MAELIQFQCPACGATLRIPLEMAAFRGPCPCCEREIIAPDPSRGIQAFEPLPPPAPFVPEPFAEPLAAPTTNEPPPPADPPAKSASPQNSAILTLAVLLTGAISLAAGYWLGTRSENPPPAIPSERTVAPPPAVTAPVPENPPPAPPPEVIVPPAENPPVAEIAPAPEPPKPAPLKTSAVAEAALKAFLDAPDWTTRSAHVLHPETTRQAMEEYSRQVSDGPTPYQSVAIQNSYTDRKTGNTLFIFQVVTEQHPTGIPVAVSETSSGWLIDWQVFVEFRDDHFRSFADGPAGKTGRFHLIVSAPPPPRAAKTENEHFSPFLLEPPLPDRQRLAYVRKTAEIRALITSATAAGAAFTPVLELTKRESPDGKSYLEITDIAATDWLPKEP